MLTARNWRQVWEYGLPVMMFDGPPVFIDELLTYCGRILIVPEEGEPFFVTNEKGQPISELDETKTEQRLNQFYHDVRMVCEPHLLPELCGLVEGFL